MADFPPYLFENPNNYATESWDSWKEALKVLNQFGLKFVPEWIRVGFWDPMCCSYHGGYKWMIYNANNGCKLYTNVKRPPQIPPELENPFTRCKYEDILEKEESSKFWAAVI